MVPLFRFLLGAWFEWSVFRRPDRSDWIAFYWQTMGILRWRHSDQIDYSDLIQAISAFNPNARLQIIELGCGSGEFLDAAGKGLRDVELIGIDGSPQMCQKAQLRVPDALILAQFYGNQDLDLPPKGASKRIIVARSTLTYIQEDQISSVMSWINKLDADQIFISEPTGKLDYDELRPEQIHKFGQTSWLRYYDLSTIRDYAEYKDALSLYDLMELRPEKKSDGRNCIWIFQKKGT